MANLEALAALLLLDSTAEDDVARAGGGGRQKISAVVFEYMGRGGTRGWG
jgi:hypothetical protein